MPDQDARNRRPAVVLRNAIELARICESADYESLHILGSFWPYSTSSFESRLVKCFKECVPTNRSEPFASQIARFYADLILARLKDESFDWMVRVLSSAETRPEDSRPLSLLADLLCSRTRARSLTHILFKSESRPPMRTVKTMSGPAALKMRVNYVLQDLFIKPCAMGGTVLLLDDICNTGASMRVYSHALREFAGADRVIAVNLAATRFSSGKDGLGMLKLDVSDLHNHPSLHPVWVDESACIHSSKDCVRAQGKLRCEVLAAAEKTGQRCLSCGP